MLFLLALLSYSTAFASAPPLPALKLHNATVSGISSGAFHAVQLQIALSSKLHGAATVAGGAYACAEGKAENALRCMLKPEETDSVRLIAKAKEWSAKGAIDPLKNLSQARVYLFQSKNDKTVKPAAAAKLKEFFEAFIPRSQIKEAVLENAAHGFPTQNYGSKCDQGGLPYIQNCGFDGAGEILSHLYPGIKKPSGDQQGNLLSFDQSLYAAKEAELLPEGRVYIPKACAAGAPCRLHIALHGCQMNTDFIQEQFVSKAGYNQWADANNIVVLYPQVDKGAANPKGCWDWFGYTGEDYALKSGKQVQAIASMIKALGI